MFFLAIRHLFSRKRQTVLIMLGIFIGTLGYVVISSMILGVQEFLVRTIIENDAHIRISAREETLTPAIVKNELFEPDEHIHWLRPPSGTRGNNHIEYAQGWFDQLDRNPQVIAYAPNLIVQVIFRRGDTSRAGRLTGTNPFRHIRITAIEESMVFGRFEDLGHSGNRIVLGSELMKSLGADHGDSVFVSAGRTSPEPFKIVGSFRFGIPELDESTAYAALGDVQKLNRTPSRISDISVRLSDANLAGEIAADWNLFSRDRLRTWEENNERILSAFVVQDAMRFVVSFSILVVAGFGIYNILTIVISQKKREIAILRSIGFDSGDVLRLFLIQGWLIGVVGGALGALLGYLVCLYLGTIQIYPENIADHGHLPFSFAPSIYATGFLLAFFSSVVSSILPAYQASKLTPIDIIRSELN